MNEDYFNFYIEFVSFFNREVCKIAIDVAWFDANIEILRHFQIKNKSEIVFFVIIDIPV